MNETAKDRLVDCLRSLVNRIDGITWPKNRDRFSDSEVYTDVGLVFREDFLKDVCRQIKPGCVVDIGCGDGAHALLLSGHADMIVAVERDKIACEILKQDIARTNIKNIIPFEIDLISLFHPLEIDNKSTFLRRINPEFVYGMALIHHLCIQDGLSMDQVAFLFSSLADDVVIEFVPEDDMKVCNMIQKGSRIGPDYSQKSCVAAFRKYYTSHSTFRIPDSDRSLLRFIRHARRQDN